SRLLARGQAPAAPATLRVRAGLIAGLLSYGPIEQLWDMQAVLPMPDARLPLALLGRAQQQHPHWRQLLEHYWCPVSAGRFWFGDEDEEDLQQVSLPHDFTIARYPTTNADFACFVAAGGYEQEQWWTPQGWQWRQKQGLDRLYPGLIAGERRFDNPLQPAVWVSWYEAVAYCRWLTHQGHTQSWLAANYAIRLPTALEWERAARGTAPGRYPWGDTLPPDSERVNGKETGLGCTSPVGCFPQGVAACGAHEMLGNVWEWTVTLNGHDQEPKPMEDGDPSDWIRLKGYDWSGYILQMSSDLRGKNFGWVDGGGFRPGCFLVVIS
ncbi:MAG: formylglycine-generating enzyme family protein, partial [Chloroflexaceae bacterium]|nr:formylglycine-generating enzyme family protein [Chloroflexaceae bacterium]